MAWVVQEPKSVKKQVEKLPPAIKEAYDLLVQDLKENGPEVPHWHHFGPIAVQKGKRLMYHCHLNKGKPRYVAIWRVRDLTITIMEMQYAGTHEGADYKRFGRV